MRRLLLLGVAAAVAVAAPLLAASAQTIEGKPKIAFIYFNVKNDGGWVQAQEEARQHIAGATSYETAFTEKVEEVSSKIRPVVERYIRRGYNVINGSAFGYSDTFKELAAEHPNVVFLNAAGHDWRDQSRILLCAHLRNPVPLRNGRGRPHKNKQTGVRGGNSLGSYGFGT